MKYDHKQEVKQFRRLMLDVMEVCPQRFKEDILLNIAILVESHDIFFPDGIVDLLDFFHRLQSGRLVSSYSAYQKVLLSNIILRLEAAHLHHYKKSYCHLTGEPRYKEFLRLKQEQKQRLEKISSNTSKSGEIKIIFTEFPFINLLSLSCMVLFALILTSALYHYFH